MSLWEWSAGLEGLNTIRQGDKAKAPSADDYDAALAAAGVQVH